ncbi:MAG TPA: DUF5916 domain-containing protein [Gemmatimonadales bacterium]
MPSATRRQALAASLVWCALALPVAAQGPNHPKDEPGQPVRNGHAQPTPTLQALERTAPIHLDGRLDEPIWATTQPATGFRQQRPDDGKPSTQRTEVRLLFDGEALYVGARMFDSLGAAGVRTRLVRRDQETESDWIELIFDTYHDHVGRTSFMVNPSGVKLDAGIASSFMDQSWDAVWDVATTIDSLGWAAEFKIPFSQLRYSGDSEQTWGLQIWRTVSRLNEMSMWSYWGVQEAGGPSRFGHVDGLRITGRQRRAEVLPYTVAQVNALPPNPSGDPFYRATSGAVRVGGDLRYLLTNTLTLDATINPDFGQVEADPAVVNLSAFETFFPERRPFFVSGGGAFGFGGFSCFFCSNTSNLSLFYSRRIGRAPQGSLPAGTAYADMPRATSILGAAKVTGRTRSGWTVGVLDAVTSSESASLAGEGVPSSQQVEPATNYFVARLKRDLRNGNAMIGGMVTSVWRALDDPLLRDRLPVHAEAAGLDWNLKWSSQTYSFMGSVAGSNVSGDSASILRLQRSSARYFQRPDRGQGGNGAFSDAYDPAATRLGGFAGYARVGKNAGNWMWEAAASVRSPGFETNDLAFLTRADYVWANANVVRQFSRPTSWYRSATLVAGTQQQVNFDGDLTDRQFHGFGRIEFLNYWGLGGYVMRRPEVDDDRALRGGPLVRRPGMTFASVFTNTDSRKPVSVGLQGNRGFADEGPSGFSVGADVTMRPTSYIALSLGPQVSRYGTAQQYVTAIEDPVATAFYGRRYVMSDLVQDDVALNTRLNVTFTPALTLELVVQPLLSSANFDRFKEFDAPGSVSKSVYGVDRGTIAPVRDADGTVTGYLIDPDGAGAAAEFRLTNPDFSYRSLRGNAVLRWEYRPGSTVYLVWTQSRDQSAPFEEGTGLGPSWRALGGARPENILLVKFNYWLSF